MGGGARPDARFAPTRLVRLKPGSAPSPCGGGMEQMASPRRRREGTYACAIALLALLAANGAARADGDAARGEKHFAECVACHKIEADTNAVGPTLHNVFGRKAGALDDFRYSSALRRSGITWSAETLDSFIADPQKVVPANRMPYAGMTDAAARADLIAYLKKAAQ